MRSVWLCLFAIVFCAPAWASPSAVIVPTHSLETVKGLVWEPGEMYSVVSALDTTGASTTFVDLTGKFDHPEWSLVIGGISVVPNEKRDFAVRVPIQSWDAPIQIISVGPRGETQQDSIRFQYLNEKRYHLIPSLGFGFVAFQQSNFPPAQQSMFPNLTQSIQEAIVEGRVQFQYDLNRRWGLNSNLSISFLPMSVSQSGTLQFSQGSVDGAYLIPFSVPSHWRFYVHAGFYYSVTFGSNTLGYYNAFGPMLFPSVSWVVNAKNTLELFIKFSPVMNSFGFLSLSSHDFAGGFDWKRKIDSKHTLDFILNASTFVVGVTSGSSAAQSISLGVGYEL